MRINRIYVNVWCSLEIPPLWNGNVASKSKSRHLRGGYIWFEFKWILPYGISTQTSYKTFKASVNNSWWEQCEICYERTDRQTDAHG